MKRYERPTVTVAVDLAEGVYMISGENMVTLEEVFEPVTDTDGVEAAEGGAAEPAGGLETSVGGTEADVEGEIRETPAEAGTEVGTEAGAENPSDVAETPDSPQTEPETAENGQPAEEAAETGEMQGSLVINCESKYMNGVWQGAKEGAWGGMKLGCKEVLGCRGCPADNGDGCGLQKPNSDQYFKMIGSLMPGWEALGKGPDDDPYGI